MKNKRICKTLSALCLTMVVAFGFPAEWCDFADYGIFD